MKNKLIASFGYAFKGIWLVVKKERNMKIHIGVLILVIIFGFLFRISPLEWIACLLCFGAVTGAEAFNTAFERFVDEVSPGFNPKFGEIKDIAAGAVLLVTISAVVVGLIVFLPKGLDFLLTL